MVHQQDSGRSPAEAGSGCQPSASAPVSAGSSQSGIPNAALLALAERVEAAGGPDRELDQLLAKVAGWVEVQHNHPSVQSCIQPDGTKRPHGLVAWAPKFTASLDAAMVLLPEGWEVALYWGNPTYPAEAQLETEQMRSVAVGLFEPLTGRAATPALALCAAALKARAASVDTHPKDGDAVAAPLVSGPVGNAETPTTSQGPNP